MKLYGVVEFEVSLWDLKHHVHIQDNQENRFEVSLWDLKHHVAILSQVAAPCV